MSGDTRHRACVPRPELQPSMRVREMSRRNLGKNFLPQPTVLRGAAARARLVVVPFRNEGLMRALVAFEANAAAIAAVRLHRAAERYIWGVSYVCFVVPHTCSLQSNPTAKAARGRFSLLSTTRTCGIPDFRVTFFRCRPELKVKLTRAALDEDVLRRTA
jgi:hypothetical protein